MKATNIVPALLHSAIFTFQKVKERRQGSPTPDT